jgi:hypothetical protein
MTIVGITPAEFTGLEISISPDIRVPIAMQAEMLNAESRLEDPGEWWLHIFGRLSDRDALKGLQQELDGMYQRSLALIPNAMTQERHLILRAGSRGQPSLQNASRSR